MLYETAKVTNFIGECKRKSIINSFGDKKGNNNNVTAVVREGKQGHRITKRVNQLNSDLKKSHLASEGSRGGKVIGHTKSGKPIYEQANHASHSSFSSQDHYEASEHHDNEYEKMEKKYPKESKRPQEVQNQMSHHAKQATEHWNKHKAGDKQLKKAIENIML